MPTSQPSSKIPIKRKHSDFAKEIVWVEQKTRRGNSKFIAVKTPSLSSPQPLQSLKTTTTHNLQAGTSSLQSTSTPYENSSGVVFQDNFQVNEQHEKGPVGKVFASQVY
jgi:hypothetical protein